MGQVADVYKSGKGIKSKKNPHQIDYLRVAFLEWLIHQLKKSNKHDIWNLFLNEWASEIPEYELPINTHRPGTLHAYVKSMRNVANVTAARKEITEVRAKLSEGEGGLMSHQSMLNYYLSSHQSTNTPDGARPKKQSKKQSEEEYIDQMKTNVQIQTFIKKRQREEQTHQSINQSDEEDQSNDQSINQSHKRSRPSPSNSISVVSNMYDMLGEEEG